MIKNIVFDFGGVLLDWNPRYLYRQYFKTEEEMENFFAKVGLYDWNATLDAGKPFAEGVKELQDRFPEYAKEIQLFDDEWRRTVKVCFPESVALLKKLKAGGLGIYGLSNWSWEKAEGLIKEYDFFKLVDGMVISGIEKVSKPGPIIYQILLNRYHLQAEECVFIDDNAANIQAADALGFNAIVFDDIHNVTDKLKSLIS